MADPEQPRGRSGKDEGFDIGSRVGTFLGEFRMIIPAMAALLGFQLVVAFQPGFENLGGPEQAASFIALCSTTAAFLFLLVPAAYHRFTAEFEETEEFLRFGRRTIATAFYFIPLTLALTLYVQGVQVFDSRAVGVAVALAVLVACIGVWWVIPLRRAIRKGHWPVHRHPPGRPEESRRSQPPQR